MQFFITHKLLTASLIIVLALGITIAWQILYVTHHYKASVPAPRIPRQAELFGAGSRLTFVVMGDSTSIGQGAEYNEGIARMSARLLAKEYQVSLTNVGVSGARVHDVRTKQLSAATALKPDLVLLAMGANDVTHLSGLAGLRSDTQAIIDELQAANPEVHILLTGSPAMGSVARFASLTQWIAGGRVRQVNAVFAEVAKEQHVILLPLSTETGPTFKRNPGLFAADNFHPNAAGYAVWWPVVHAGLAKTGLLNPR